MVFVLALIGAALAVLIVNHDTGFSFGLPNTDLASLVYLGLIGAVIGAGVVGAHRNIGEMIKNLLGLPPDGSTRTRPRKPSCALPAALHRDAQ